MERTAARWRPELRRELTWLLALKVLALLLLWGLFFSPAHRTRVDARAISERLGVTYTDRAPAAAGGDGAGNPATAARTRCPEPKQCR